MRNNRTVAERKILLNDLLRNLISSKIIIEIEHKILPEWPLLKTIRRE